MPIRHLAALGAIVVMLALVVPASAGQPDPPQLILLRRVSFDPLHEPPGARTASISPTTLQLVQFSTPPDAATLAALRASGITPLAYVPENALLVRARQATQAARMASMRWSGPFLPSYKLAPELDAALAEALPVTLTVLATPDAAVSSLVEAAIAAGGRVLGQGAGAFGPALRIEIATRGVPALLARDDVLWIEPWHSAAILNDKGRESLSIDEARAVFPQLTGAGQIVAIADTGLDIQESVLAAGNPDFPPERIVAGANLCLDGGDWTDRVGHGTHVAGTVLGGGMFSGQRFAGIAPGAWLVIVALAAEGGTGGQVNLCAFDTTDLLSYAYESGARIQNMSWGYPSTNGAYNAAASEIDQFVARHPDYLVVVAAGNDGQDCLPYVSGSACQRDGVIDPGSINTPGTAKNALTVGATESERPQFRETWGSDYAKKKIAVGEPIASDLRSNTASGMAAFSSRGPTQDGRLKPEIVAPGVNIVSAVSHYTDSGGGAGYSGGYYPGFGLNYAYESGTSMATPMVSGAAALVRQWLADERGMAEPSAALVKALLLNGATEIAPGQYGMGASREIPASWPNNVEGWGRANVAASIGLGNTPLAVDYATNGGLRTGEQADFSVELAAGQTFRATLVWSDPAALPNAAKTLVNNLDLQLIGPDSEIARGNAAADLPAACRQDGADTCNNAETIRFTASTPGVYTLRVTGTLVRGTVQSPGGPQPFALAAASPPWRVFAPNTVGK